MKKRETIGKMSNTRATWQIKPQTQVKPDRTKYNRKQKHRRNEEF